jgi:hypothetical protein
MEEFSKHYKKRGITYCARWETFENFYADMGDPPSPKHSLDRIDNNKGYSKENCRWATGSQQARNRRVSRMVEYKGKTKNLYDWAEELGISIKVLQHRMWDGWDVEKAFTKPAQTHSPKGQGKRLVERLAKAKAAGHEACPSCGVVLRFKDVREIRK